MIKVGNKRQLNKLRDQAIKLLKDNGHEPEVKENKVLLEVKCQDKLFLSGLKFSKGWSIVMESIALVEKQGKQLVIYNWSNYQGNIIPSGPWG